VDLGRADLGVRTQGIQILISPLSPCLFSIYKIYRVDTIEYLNLSPQLKQAVG
jgi:hypothetical protein